MEQIEINKALTNVESTALDHNDGLTTSNDVPSTVNNNDFIILDTNKQNTCRNNNNNNKNNNTTATTNNNTGVYDINESIILEKGVKGTVVTVNRLKHYSFIKRKDKLQSRDIFAREASIVNEKNQRKFFISDTCKFDLIKTPRGLEAVNINIIERHIDSISKLPKIPKKHKEQQENNQSHVSTDFFKQTITELFREALNKKK